MPEAESPLLPTLVGSETDDAARRCASIEASRAIRSSTYPDGTPVYSIPVALSIMVFFALCAQCVSTLLVIQRETNSWRWPVLSFTYMTLLAYVGSLLTYQIGSRLF